jgi:hypothetical protein
MADCASAIREHSRVIRENTEVNRRNLLAITELTQALKRKPSTQSSTTQTEKKERVSRWDAPDVDLEKQSKEFNFAWTNPNAGRNDYQNDPRF